MVKIHIRCEKSLRPKNHLRLPLALLVNELQKVKIFRLEKF